jgi:hypothetical protein
MSAISDIRARLAALRASTLAPKNPLAVVAARGGMSPEKPPDAAPPVTPPASAARSELASTPFAIPALTARKKTLARKQLAKDASVEERRLGPEEEPVDVDAERPKTRSDCFGGPRPCPYVSCRYHTYLDVTEAGGLVISRPDVDVAELTASCSLDVADRGPVTLAEAGKVLNFTQERARQVEATALRKLAVAVDPDAAAEAGVLGARFVGSCKARCALTGKVCALPVHDVTKRKHRCGSYEFHLTALEGQTLFPHANRIDSYSQRRSDDGE